MYVELSTVYDDGYFVGKVFEDNTSKNYLEFMWSPIDGWGAIIAKVDGKSFKRDNLRYSWKRSGRGRAKEETWNKLYEMQQFFIDNSESLLLKGKEYLTK